MTIRDKKRIAIPLVVLCLMAVAVALSKPVRTTFKTVLASVVSPAAASADVEQRARARHGWDRQPILNSVTHGTITYYDRSGIAVQRVGLTIYRKFPDRVRLEINRPGGQEVSGFDGQTAWRAGVAQLRDADARDIRGWARMWPERLFIGRGNGEPYREVGRFQDERAKASVTGEVAESDAEVVADQVEVEDNVGPAPANPRNGADWRRVSFYVDSETSLVYTARWMEPNDPSRQVDDLGAALMDLRVDFRRWTQVEGMIWPFEIIHRRGGKTDFRVEVADVQFNQQMPDTIFQQP
jgi:outer membrane lipoprotein-sorting protein